MLWIAGLFVFFDAHPFFFYLNDTTVFGVYICMLLRFSFAMRLSFFLLFDKWFDSRTGFYCKLCRKKCPQ